METKPEKTTCPECSAEFEVDDRLECIFADTKKMRVPVNGTVCGVCGLVADWKLGIVESMTIKPAEVWELLDGVIVY